jgi:hypothetical protein
MKNDFQLIPLDRMRAHPMTNELEKYLDELDAEDHERNTNAALL